MHLDRLGLRQGEAAAGTAIQLHQNGDIDTKSPDSFLGYQLRYPCVIHQVDRQLDPYDFFTCFLAHTLNI